MILTREFKKQLCQILEDESIAYYQFDIIFKKISLEEYTKTKAKLEILQSCLEITVNHNILDIDYSSDTVRDYISSKYNLKVIKNSDNHIEIEGGTSKEFFTDSCYVGIEHTDVAIRKVCVYDTAFIVNSDMEFSLEMPKGHTALDINNYDLSEVDFDETLEISQVLRDVNARKLILPKEVFGSSKQRRSLIAPFKGVRTTILDLTNTSFEYTNAARDLFAGLEAKTLKLGTLDLSHLRNSIGNFGKVFNNSEINNIVIDKILVADDYMRADFSASMSGSRNESMTAINGEYDTLINNYKKLREMIEVVANKTKEI